MSSWEIVVEVMRLAPRMHPMECLAMPLDLALTLIDARARTMARRVKATPAPAAEGGADGGRRVVNHGDGKQTVHYSGEAALEAMLRPMPLGR